MRRMDVIRQCRRSAVCPAAASPTCASTAGTSRTSPQPPQRVRKKSGTAGRRARSPGRRNAAGRPDLGPFARRPARSRRRAAAARRPRTRRRHRSHPRRPDPPGRYQRHRRPARRRDHPLRPDRSALIPPVLTTARPAEAGNRSELSPRVDLIASAAHNGTSRRACICSALISVDRVADGAGRIGHC